MPQFTLGYTFASLRLRDYRLLWLGQVSTSMGQWMDQVTRGWLIYQITGSAWQLGLATALRGLPLLFFGVLAGAVADRSNRKAQLVLAQVTNALLNIVLATLVLLHRVQPWHVYLTGFLAGTVQAFQQPSRQTLISDIVGARHLMNALALNAMALNVSRALGPALAGILIAVIGAHGSYYTQAAMFLLATVWTWQMVMPARSQESAAVRGEAFWHSITAGFTFVWHDHDIRTLMLLAHGPLTLGMPYMSLLPIFAKDVLHGGPRLQGLLLTLIGIGSVLGSLAVASIPRRYSYGHTVVIGALAFGLGLLGFALANHMLVSSLCAFWVGVSTVVYQTQNQTMLQLLAPRHMRGRVMSLFLLNRGLVPLGTFVAGVLAEHLGGPLALQIMSLAVIGVVGLVALLTPRFLALRVEFQDRVPRP
ncbi:MAG: MFS transporter [Candidatus Tectimicrobiota bacterium]